MTTDDAERRLETFLGEFDPEIAERARASRAALYPGANRLIFDNYNALVVGFGPSERSSEAAFSIAFFPKWIRLFFLHGAYFDDPRGVLEGDGKQVRSVILEDASDLSRRERRDREGRLRGTPRATPRAAFSP